jgi:16S rRNA (cytosine967-C5)-methyltransferase
MTPAARAGAAVELLDRIVAAAREDGPAADTLIAAYFRERRYAGSGDRRAIRELVYRAIRRAGERPDSGRAALLGLADEDPALAAAFDGSRHAPPPPVPGEARAPAAAHPAWLAGRFDPLLDAEALARMLDRAPLDLRVNRLKATREEAMALLPGAAATLLSPVGLRLAAPEPLADHPAVTTGLVEVQDEGSQLVALACEAAPAQLAVDLCAGAGGKSLALAAEMANSGRIVACDIDRRRQAPMAARLERAGVTIAETRLLDPGREREALADLRGAADLVLVDAPCSGTGTWRRNPEARWRLTPEKLARLVATQAYLLDVAAELVRPGGILVYAVCSLLRDEGRDQAAAFVARSAFVSEGIATRGGRPAGPGLLLSPDHDGTDGFFVARWRAPC